MKLLKYTRRSLLQQSLLTGPALASLEILLESIVKGLITKAHAEATGGELPPFLFIIHQEGAQQRWGWDFPLKQPYSSATTLNDEMFIPNSGVGNRFETLSGNPNQYDVSKTVYDTYNLPISGNRILRMPWLWQASVPTTDGDKPMADLLNNWLGMRGVVMPRDDHEANLIRLTTPDAAQESLDGAVASCPGVVNSRLIPAVVLSTISNNAFRSKSGIGGTLVDLLQYDNVAGGLSSPTPDPATYNRLKPLFEAFSETKAEIFSNYFSRRQALDSAIEGVFGALKNYSKTQMGPKADALFAMRHSIEDQIRNSIGTIVEAFPSAYNMYHLMATEAIKRPVVGIDDKMAPANPSYNFYGFGRTAVAQSDLSKMLQDPAAPAYMHTYPETFAIAEILFKNGFSNSVSIHMGFGRNPLQFAKAPGVYDAWTTDEHGASVGPSQIANKGFFMGLSAQMRQFVHNMGPLWDRTVLYYISEMGRKNMYDGSGFHLPDGNNASIFSGMIQGPIVVGNVQKADVDPSKNCFGTQGKAAPSQWGPEAGNTVATIDYKNVVNTVAMLTEAELPAGANIHPVALKNAAGKVTEQTLLVEKAKNV